MTNLEKVAILTSFACIIKFLLEGVTVGESINFGHADSMVYAAMLAPLWGTHGYITARKQSTRKVDNPDESET